MYLTFDWDDVEQDEPIVQTALQELQQRFGVGTIWYRISSSGEGIHVIIANLSWNANLGFRSLCSGEWTVRLRLCTHGMPIWGLGRCAEIAL